MGADVAIGSRYVAGGKDVGHSFMARAFSVAINALASLLLGRGVRDYTSGFVVARRSVFDRIILHGHYGEYCIDLLARAQRLCFRSRKSPTYAAHVSAANRRPARVGDYLQRGWKYVATVVKLARS